MKKILLSLLVLVAISACTPMEEKRDALMDNALKSEKEGNCAAARTEAQKAVELDPLFAGAYLLMGRCDMKADKRGSAAENYASALEILPESLEALEALSRIALIDGDLDKAREYTDKALSLGDGSVEIRIIQAGVLMKQKDYAAAKPLLEEAVLAKPGDEEAIVGLASAYLNTQEKEKAVALLKKSLDLLPESKAILSLLLNIAVQDKDFAGAEAYLQKLMTLVPDEPDLYMQLADLHLMAKDIDKSIQILRDFLQKHPANEAVRLRLAETLLLKQDVQEALALLDEAPDRSPTITFNKANILARAGRLEEAIALLGGLAGEPRAKDVLTEVRFALSELYLQKRMPEEAERELSAIIAAEPDNPKALVLRGRIYFSMQRYEDSANDLARVVEKNPKDYMAGLALADTQNALGHPALAERIVTGIISREPRYADAYTALANLYLLQGKADAALMTLRIGKTSAPHSPNIPLMEAELLSELKRYKEAAAVLEALAKQKPYAQEALLRLGNIYGSAGDHKKAIEAFDRLLAINADIRVAAEGRVRAQIEAKQEKAALAFAEKRQKDRPEDPAAAFLVAEVALANKNKKRTEQALLQALDLAPEWEQPLDLLVKLYLMEGQVDKVISTCRNLLKKAPDAVPPAILLAMMQEQKGELTNAEKGYRAILEKRPDELIVINNLASLLAMHKPDEQRLKEAETLAAKAAATGEPTALDTLAWIQHLQGRSAAAEPNARKAKAAFKDNPVVDYHLAAILAAQNDKEKQKEAKQLLQNINSKYKNFRYKKDVDALLKKVE